MINKLIDFVLPGNAQTRALDEERELIRREATIGGTVFGAVPSGHRREFFCLDAHTWIWHEEWIDSKGVRQNRTTRYDIRPSGILKAQGNGTYHRVSREEATHLYEATKLYRQRVVSQLYANVS